MLCIADELRQYADHLNGYDEAVSPEGTALEGWQPLLGHIQSAGEDTRQRWRNAIRRDLRDDGLTFAMLADASHSPRGGNLDAIPWIFSAEEWSRIEAGVAQRARLLEEVARDLLGPRRLLREGHLPADVLFAQAGYLRACIGVPSNIGRYLFSYACDLARGPDGNMWVLGDKTQAPSGAGYALENRTILSRIYPDLFSQLQVRRLASFFRGFREAMMQQYEGRRLEPRVVVLTPGPYSATYFEHAYLASYLGYTLAQGGDLLMRDGALWLKTLEGLQPVDILLRRVDADYCDPLELRRDSYLGIPGLLAAMRNGRAACVNHPGCGVLENRGLMPFLTPLCRQLLGEDPLLPSAATWWCGQKKEREHVLAHLKELVIKPIHRGSSADTIFGALCSRAELAALREKILRQPNHYVGQEQIGFSTVPVLDGEGLQPRRSVLRAFACSQPDGYAVMPGGLARSAADPESHRVNAVEGGMLKDVWVLADAPQPHRSLWLESAGGRDENTWFGGVFTSRSAEHLFWVGRYAERIGRQVRALREILRVRQGSLLEDAATTAGVLAGLTHWFDLFCGQWAPEDDELPHAEWLLERVAGEEAPGSLQKNLRSLLFAAYAVRDVWSQDSWRVLTAIETQGEATCREVLEPVPSSAALDELIGKLHAFHGLNACGMTRESGWAMLMLGRILESGLGLCDLIEGLLIPEAGPEVEYAVMESALSQNENLITYRRHYRTTPHKISVLDLMLAMEANPKGLIFHLAQATDLLHNLPPPVAPARIEAAVLHLKQLRSRLGQRPWRSPAPEEALWPGLLADIRAALEQTSDAVSSAYFSHTSTHALEAF